MDIEKIWPEWKVEKVIGKGSYGTVYKCSRNTTGWEGKPEYAAIKVISIPQDEAELIGLATEGMTAEQTREYYWDIVQGFMNEIKILKTLKGEKNVVNIYEYTVVEKKKTVGFQLFIRMELLSDFNSYIGDKVLGEREVLSIARDLCSALEVCSKKKIIHRDIKPENIFVDDNGTFKLGDFGVAKQMEKTNASMSMKGTYNYMAPEVLESKKYDSRADIYSLGLVMYRLLNNNRLPFVDRNKQIVKYSERQEAFERRVKGEEIPPIEGVSDEVNDIILKACEFKPEDRFDNVSDFSDAIIKALVGTNKKAEKSASGKKTGLTSKQNLKYIAIILVSLAVLASVLAVSFIRKRQKSMADAEQPTKTENYVIQDDFSPFTDDEITVSGLDDFSLTEEPSMEEETEERETEKSRHRSDDRDEDDDEDDKKTSHRHRTGAETTTDEAEGNTISAVDHSEEHSTSETTTSTTAAREDPVSEVNNESE